MKHIATIAVLFILMFLPFHMNFVSLNKDSAFTACAEEIYTVTARTRLRMRDNLGQEGKVTGNIPFGSKVQVLEKSDKKETISGIQGNWVRIQWNDKTGWVFSGFLTSGDTTGKNVKIILIPSLEKSW